MITTQALEGYLGMHINAICKNDYSNDNDNHCAHFVSHVLGLSFGVTCRMMGNGKAPGANVRVQEVFGHCRKVGTWELLPPALQPCMAFITNSGNVNLRAKVMTNVPRKHMGIYVGGFIWHYSNVAHKVVKQIPAEFSYHYPAPDNAMFYGTIA